MPDDIWFTDDASLLQIKLQMEFIMSSEISTALTLISGISWTLVYMILIRRGLQDQTYGMPLFALSLNLAWEFFFSFFFRDKDLVTVQTLINIIWCGFDLVIVYSYFKYGRKDFVQHADTQWFVPWSLAAFVMGFVVIYVSALEFGSNWGAIYTAFAQNLIMSVLFVGMLSKRKNVDGQSIYAAILKWIGTAAPTILFFGRTGSKLVLVLGIGCFIYDALYTYLLYRKFQEMGLNPFTRKPVGITVTSSVSSATNR